ncbi:MAG TPA: Ig-like domain-containing protein [Bryobacteraceae bacterium]|nr:Ig-like domain-containing protein [Bryobacteraceae bacterium]
MPTGFRRLTILLLLPVIGPAVFAQCTGNPIPGRFFEYYIVAQTGSCNGNNFTSLGSYPAINDLGQVGFVAQTSALPGSALFLGDGHNHPAATPINPGEIGSSEIYDPAVQVGSTYPGAAFFVSKDSITTTSPATTSIRVWNTATPDSFRYAGRGGNGQTYGAVFPYPSVNKKGDAAFIALDSRNPQLKYLVQSLAAGGTHKADVSVSVGEPMIDDVGDVLLFNPGSNPATDFQILLYASGLAHFTVIADHTYFDSIDSAPGISRDGNVIAFQGTLNAAGTAALSINAGPGIFAAWKGTSSWIITRLTGLMVETPNTGGNNDGFCDPGETCQPGAELGFDDAGNPIYFTPTGYGTSTRVAVTNLGLGASGIANDSFVVSFVGTPSQASRANPVLKNGTPLFFSAQQGLWTVRVDIENYLAATVITSHARTAIPVVQINDRIGSNVVTAIGAYDSVANAAEDETGAVRTMRRGDHRVAFWASTANGNQVIVRANHLDSDQDGLLDHWETTGIDMDQDGVVDLDLASMGANVNSRDVFLQLDWITDNSGLAFSYQPAPGVISPVSGQGTVTPFVSMFENAPALTGTMYGVRIDNTAPASIPKGIALHIDGGSGSDKNGGPFSLNMGAGPLDGGGKIGASGNSHTGYAELLYFNKPNALTIPGVTTRGFQDVKDNYFGSQDKDGRELAFHFGVFGGYFDAYKDNGGAYSWKVAVAGPNTLTSQSPLPPLPVDGGQTGFGHVIKITGGKGAGQYQTINDELNSTTLQTIGNWTTVPDSTSTFSILLGNLGNSEVFFWPSPDNNSLPGNDFMVATGPTQVPPYAKNVTPAGLTGTPCLQWRVMAHELGHTLGLRHGGTDHYQFKGNNYLSLMSYSWQNVCNTASAVQSYSGANDPTFDDWANLQHNFSDAMLHLGNTLGLAFGTFPEDQQFTPETSFADYVNTNGPTDTTPPVVAIKSPAANGKVGLTQPLKVTVTATDNIQVQSVTVSFDANGNGAIDPSELVIAKSSGTNTYTANFPALSGPAGSRTITASAVDPIGNSASATESVNVVPLNPLPGLVSLSPPSATHGGKAFTLTVNGSNFVSGCSVMWNGAARTTTFVNSGQVTAKIQAADIANAGTASVTVRNPAPGGGTSNALTFTIN